MSQLRRGTCAHCQWEKSVTTFGRIYQHDFPPGRTCPGSGELPLEDNLIALLENLPVQRGGEQGVVLLNDLNAVLDAFRLARDIPDVIETPTLRSARGDANDLEEVMTTLRNRRRALGWTIAEIAEQLQVTEPTVSAWEVLRRSIPLRQACAYAKLLGYRVEVTEISGSLSALLECQGGPSPLPPHTADKSGNRTPG